MTFSKNDPRPHGMPKQVVLARFQPVVTHFGPSKVPKCLKNGPIWDQKWVENWSRKHFSEIHPRPFGMHKRMN